MSNLLLRSGRSETRCSHGASEIRNWRIDAAHSTWRAHLTCACFELHFAAIRLGCGQSGQERSWLLLRWNEGRADAPRDWLQGPSMKSIWDFPTTSPPPSGTCRMFQSDLVERFSHVHLS